MQSEIPYQKTLVLIGGGHSHIAVLKQFGMNPLPGLRIILISRNIDTPYSGMLPGYLAGHYDYDDCHIDLMSLTNFANTTLIQAEVNGLDPERKEIYCVGRPPIRYDTLSINIGSTPNTVMIPGAEENTFAVKPIDQFINKWDLFIDKILESDKPLNIAVVGAGAGGVELTLSTQFRINKHPKAKSIQHKFSLLTGNTEILSTHNKNVRNKFKRILTERKVNILTNHYVTEVKQDILCCENGKQLPVNIVIWVTHASAQPWLKDSGIETDEHGFVRINDFLQSNSHPNIFAAGDISSSIRHPRPKSGVFAVRQGPYLSTNLRHQLLRKPFKKYVPQKQFLSLISSGDQYAVISRGNLAIEGKWVWQLKNWIDKKFVQKYVELPDMATQSNATGTSTKTLLEQDSSATSHQIRCSGCGAKVGSSVLSKVIRKLKPLRHDNILLGLHEPDDAAAIQLSSDKVFVQSVDYFRAIIKDEFLFGKITANHALGDIFAMGAQAHSAMAIATIPYASNSIVEEQLYQMLSGAVEALNEAGCSLVGGHSSEGSELAFGLTINGMADPENLLRKSTVQTDQVLILTKPLGTGTLFAASMQGKCRGQWIENAIQTMLQSNKTAADIFLKYKASACTDVTGFGLIGHLLEMLGSNEDITLSLNLDALPILDGAQETISAGIVSSLQEDNLKAETVINASETVTHINYPLLFDPQTAGGLLGFVPKENTQDCLVELHNKHYSQAVIIGEIKGRKEPSESIITLN